MHSKRDWLYYSKEEVMAVPNQIHVYNVEWFQKLGNHGVKAEDNAVRVCGQHHISQGDFYSMCFSFTHFRVKHH